MVTKVKVVCEFCNKQFERSVGEIKRNKKLGRRIYCSRNCTGKVTFTENIPVGKRYNIAHLVASNRLDEFSPFRLPFRTAKRHAKEKNKEFNLTLECLKQLWDKQKGICVYTGWELELPKTSKGTARNYRKASIDRKDSTKGYTPDNIQFVSYMANCAKNCFDESELIAFCEAVVKHKNI
jgi:hypothetical protein